MHHGKYITQIPLRQSICGILFLKKPKKVVAKAVQRVYNKVSYTKMPQEALCIAAKGGASMRIVPGFIVRQIADQIVAIPTGESARTLSGLVALNDTGRFLFDLLQTPRTEAELIEAMQDAYEVDHATAQADVAEFLQILRQSQLLDEAE